MRMIKLFFVVIFTVFFLTTGLIADTIRIKKTEAGESNNMKIEYAYFSGGCFWCMEAVFENVDGVIDVVSGYAGGTLENPTYKDVCTGTTGHAEVVRIKYNPSVVTYDELLDIFWSAHDPTALNRQGADIGSQYRSIILYINEKQREIAEKSKENLEKSKKYKKPIVTEIVQLKKIYPAEGYHQDYYKKNPYAPYCLLVIKPKLDKLNFK